MGCGYKGCRHYNDGVRRNCTIANQSVVYCQIRKDAVKRLAKKIEIVSPDNPSPTFQEVFDNAIVFTSIPTEILKDALNTRRCQLRDIITSEKSLSRPDSFHLYAENRIKEFENKLYHVLEALKQLEKQC